MATLRIPSWIGLCCFLSTVANAQSTDWRFNAVIGYSRTFQIEGIDGGYHGELQLQRRLNDRVDAGVVIGRFRLGSSHEISDIILPAPGFVDRERARSGWHFGGLFSRRVGKRFSILLAPNVYALEYLNGSVKRDSMGVLIEPPSKVEDTAWGVGVMVGGGINVLRISDQIGLGIEIRSHLMGVWEKDEDGAGKSLQPIQFLSVGGRVSFGF